MKKMMTTALLSIATISGLATSAFAAIFVPGAYYNCNARGPNAVVDRPQFCLVRTTRGNLKSTRDAYPALLFSPVMEIGRPGPMPHGSGDPCGYAFDGVRAFAFKDVASFGNEFGAAGLKSIQNGLVPLPLILKNASELDLYVESRFNLSFPRGTGFGYPARQVSVTVNDFSDASLRGRPITYACDLMYVKP